MCEVTTITPAEIKLALVKEVMEHMRNQAAPYSYLVIVTRVEELYRYIAGMDQ